MKELFSILLICIAWPLVSYADYVSNGFFVVDKSINFDKKIPSGKCNGSTPYPQLSNSDEELFMRINDEIHDFVELYAICNKGERDNFAVTYDIPNSGTKEFFSVRWMTKKDGELFRIDSINFNAETGAVLKPDNIFNMLSDNMMVEMIKLSNSHLAYNCTWENFLEKIASRDIQLYLIEDVWYIVFNETNDHKKAIDTKLPEYFLIGNRDHDRG